LPALAFKPDAPTRAMIWSGDTMRGASWSSSPARQRFVGGAAAGGALRAFRSSSAFAPAGESDSHLRFTPDSDLWAGGSALGRLL
jgi:hypothetical protein